MAQLTLSGAAGPIFGIAWRPDGSTIATAGFDGNVRFYDAKTGALVKQFVPVPIGDAKEPATQPASAQAQ